MKINKKPHFDTFPTLNLFFLFLKMLKLDYVKSLFEGKIKQQQTNNKFDSFPQEEIDQFTEWLKHRENVPSHQEIIEMRKVYRFVEAQYPKNKRECNFYKLEPFIHILKQFETTKYLLEKYNNMVLFRYFTNQYQKTFTQDEKEKIIEKLKTFKSEANVWETFSVILTKICYELEIPFFESISQECAICLNNIGWEEYPLDCGHVYHKHCLSKLKSCPICKEFVKMSNF